jgi:hypothetical protein
VAFTKVASFWKNDPGKGKSVLRGNAEREGITLPPNAKLMMFTNDKGDNPKRPDFRLVLVTEDDDQAAPPRGYEEPQAPPDDFPF